jgi:hypothetical protein
MENGWKNHKNLNNWNKKQKSKRRYDGKYKRDKHQKNRIQPA